MLIDSDPIYRAGLRVVLEFAQLQVVAEAENSGDALHTLSELSNNTTNIHPLGVDLVLLDLRLDSQPNQLSGLKLCRQLKTQYPNLPVLLLSSTSEPTQLLAAQQAGADGYCAKGISRSKLVAAIQQVAAGRSYWEYKSAGGAGDAGGAGGAGGAGDASGENHATCFMPTALPSSRGTRPTECLGNPSTAVAPKFKISTSLMRFSNRLRRRGLQQIDTSLAEVTAQLQVPGLTVLERAMLAGQRRELLASRWLVNRLLATPEDATQEPELRRSQSRASVSAVERTGVQNSGVRTQESELRSQNLSFSPTSPTSLSSPSSLLAPRASSVLASVRSKLQFSLENLTRVPLEIDILREGKKRELLNIILQKVEETLTELRFSQVHSSQLTQMRSAIARDLWQAAITDFFGKYSTLQVGDRQIEFVNTLLQDAEMVQTAILDKIPLVVELFSYLLFKHSLLIDSISYTTENPEVEERAEIILQNLLIQLANGVVQTLLNNFADVEVIKQNYYDRRLISTREIERFRNNLSWKYRLESNLIEPTKIFESRYEMFLLINRGIAKISIYAPRRQELARLSGIPLSVTLALEFRDAIAPRLRAVVEFFGNGFVYILTQVVGRAIGLIGRGILQGLGGSLQDSKNKKF